MATRPKGTRFWKGGNAGGTVMTGIGNLYSAFLSWKGVTSGDRVLILDGATVIEEIILQDTANNGISIPMPTVGKEFATSLVVTPVLTGGEMNISIGYDANGG
jgi:hypothetical protein